MNQTFNLNTSCMQKESHHGLGTCCMSFKTIYYWQYNWWLCCNLVEVWPLSKDIHVYCWSWTTPTWTIYLHNHWICNMMQNWLVFAVFCPTILNITIIDLHHKSNFLKICSNQQSIPVRFSFYLLSCRTRLHGFLNWLVASLLTTR